MANNVYWEDIEVGYEIPKWTRKTDFMHWNRYAAVNDEFVYIHMDDEAGRAGANEQGAFGMGNLRFAYLHNMLRDWAGDEAWVKTVGLQYRAINQKNDILVDNDGCKLHGNIEICCNTVKFYEFSHHQ